jgi:predicted phage terminase large subunit-like protein
MTKQRGSRPPNGRIISRGRGEVCRQDFVSFIQMCFDILHPGKSLQMASYIEVLADHLEQVRAGRCNRLMMNVPPRYLKSFITSVAFPAYVLGHDPTKRVIVVSYGAELAVSLANDFRKIISSPRYKSVFPGLQISRMKNTESEIVTTQGGFRLATSVEGALTGRGADIIIIDDPLKPSDASSQAKRERVNEWYKTTLLSRLDDKQKGVIIIVMQRLHDDDPCGFILKNSPGWVVLSFPAIAREDERIQIGQGRFHERCVGDALHPEREPKFVLDQIRAEQGEDIFAAQYQQCPSQPMGVVIKRDYIRYYDDLPLLRTRSPYLLQSWDTAIGVAGHNDYSACLTVLLDEQNNYYVVDDVRDRLPYPDLKDLAIAQAKKHKPTTILIEAAGLGKKLADDLRAAGLSARAVIPEGDKEIRVSIQLEKFKKGQVFFPRQAPWLAALVNELLAFPNARYDDQLDALVQALAHYPYLSPASLNGWKNLVNGLWGY